MLVTIYFAKAVNGSFVTSLLLCRNNARHLKCNALKYSITSSKFIFMGPDR